MFQIKNLSSSDYNFAVKLANTMDWNMAVEDFEYMASLEPNGNFLLLDDQKPIGIATCISYGKIGWFGNLIIDPAFRRKGAGSLLVKHAIDYLQGKDVETIGLFAYPQLRDFYGRLGFKSDLDFTLLSAKNLCLIETAGAQKIGESSLRKIALFDSYFFGGDRSRLIESIVLEAGNVGYYISDRGHVIGYIAATIYESMVWLGPLVCLPSRYDVAGRLVSAVLAKIGDRRVYVVASKTDSVLLDLFLSLGFKEEFTVNLMFSGIPLVKNCIYLAESLERG